MLNGEFMGSNQASLKILKILELSKPNRVEDLTREFNFEKELTALQERIVNSPLSEMDDLIWQFDYMMRVSKKTENNEHICST